MFKRAIGVLAVCAATGAVCATSVKIRSFVPAGPGVALNPNGDGIAKVKVTLDEFGSPTSFISIHLQDFAPNEVYAVLIEDAFNGIDYNNVLALATNSAGNGLFEVELPTIDASDTPKITIYMWDGQTDEFNVPDDIVTAGELRAIGEAGF